MNRFFGHLKTVLHHKKLVFIYCVKAGIPLRGILHDLSKFSFTEFFGSVKYFSDGKRSPTVAERNDKGYSAVWLHHKGRNKHHRHGAEIPRGGGQLQEPRQRQGAATDAEQRGEQCRHRAQRAWHVPRTDCLLPGIPAGPHQNQRDKEPLPRCLGAGAKGRNARPLRRFPPQT